MKSIEQLKHHPVVEELVDILSARTQNPDKAFFTILTCYHLTKLASMMRTSIDAQGFGNLQCNFYGINTAPSGYGKGHSTKIIEEQVVHLFKSNFMDFTLPSIAEKTLTELAIKRATRNNTTDDEELEKVKAEYRKLGVYLTSFDSGTTPAIKQFRHGLLMSGIGSINFECDEMASNLINNTEVLTTYLELYDGVTKPKLTKNTAESTRNEEIEGKTPTNMMMYGTAALLLDGSVVENTFRNILTTGYARRSFFGYSNIEHKAKKLTAKERIKALTDTSTDAKLAKLSIKLEKLSDPVNYKFQVKVPDDVMEAIVDYQIHCEELIDGMKSTEVVQQTEAKGRHFKTIRLAGVFAFLDSNPYLTMENWEAAVKIAEISAVGFNNLLNQPPPHARLANFLAECPDPMTYADLMEELPCFPKTSGHQKDLIRLAIAHGHKHNIIIKRSFIDDIEFIQGESLQKTNIDECILSYSHDLGTGYRPEDKVKFSDLQMVTQHNGIHWCNHHFIEGRRKKTHVIKGFNLLVLDIDGTCPLEQAKSVLEKYTYHIYTTKSHQQVKDGNPAADRYRIVMPMSHKLKLSPEEYKEFMDNVLETLPFDTDEQTTQPNRKWLSHIGEVHNNNGELFDVLPFIPKTKKNEERKTFIESNGSMDKLERHFFNTIGEGNRNNTLYKYGAALMDSGRGLDDLILKVKAFNDKLPKPIPLDELQSTVIQSVTQKYMQKG